MAEQRRMVKEDLRGAELVEVDLRGAVLRHVDLTGARMRGVFLEDVEITGAVRNLVVNGVDVGPLVEAELNRRYPERALMRPSDADGFRRAWDALTGLWEGTYERARGLDPALLHERVDGEWSFTQTLRHLVFATDAWVGRALLGDAEPWHPLDLPFEQLGPVEGIPCDDDARPSLEEVLELRRSRWATVRAVLDDLTDEGLAGSTEPVQPPADRPGWPPPRAYPVRQCLEIVVEEEWEHRLYAERDLDVLAAGREDGA
jgi:hypothetical protein